MSRNPYAAFLEGREAGSLVREFPSLLNDVISRLGPDVMSRSLAPGKWTVSQTLCHLADTELAFSFRWRQTLAEDRHVVQPFDQDRWAPHYASMAGEDALRTFLALRQWNVILLDRLLPEEWDREAIHPELGEMTFRTLVEVMAGHDRNHLEQFEKIAARQG
jgi:hypothetical protein